MQVNKAMFDLTKFTLQDMANCGDALQQFELKAENIEELADLMVHYFYDNFIDKQTGKNPALSPVFS